MGMKRLLSEDGQNGGTTTVEPIPMDDKTLISNLHRDMLSLTKSVDRLSDTIEPLSEHMPALVEVAKVWNTGKAVGRSARFVAGFLKWLGGVAVSIAAIYLLLHAKFGALSGLHNP